LSAIYKKSFIYKMQKFINKLKVNKNKINEFLIKNKNKKILNIDI